jgi:hypothetical protein
MYVGCVHGGSGALHSNHEGEDGKHRTQEQKARLLHWPNATAAYQVRLFFVWNPCVFVYLCMYVPSVSASVSVRVVRVPCVKPYLYPVWCAFPVFKGLCPLPRQERKKERRCVWCAFPVFKALCPLPRRHHLLALDRALSVHACGCLGRITGEGLGVPKVCLCPLLPVRAHVHVACGSVFLQLSVWVKQHISNT